MQPPQNSIIERVQGTISSRWGTDLLARLPGAGVRGARCLEFGCGDGRARSAIEQLGYQWTGVDIAGDGMTARCDGHRLPFRDTAFDLVVTVAVFEHLYDPFQAARELYRVLKPGGVVVGTTAFLEHFHANSYFHMTHLGVQRVFSLAGFQVEELWPTWHFSQALASFWIPTQLGLAHRLLTAGSGLLAGSLMRARTWGLRLYLARKGLDEHTIGGRVQSERLAWSGAIGFRLCKPPSALKLE